MKVQSIVAFLVGGASVASAHYTLTTLVVDGVESKAWEYVRQNTRKETYMPTKFINSPGITPLDDDFRCNEGTFGNAGKTKVAEVAPGASLALKLGVQGTMRHPGPATAYMSKAPGNVTQYDGSGLWFKIYDETTCGSTADGLQDTDWCTWDKDRISFKVPVGTPPGEYLVRAEHIALHGGHVGEAEFYYSCAQIRVTGSGTGVPGPLVNIPGVYEANDPAIRFNIYGAKNYPYHPGPIVWQGSSGTNPAPALSSSSTFRVPTSTAVLSSATVSIIPSGTPTTLNTVIKVITTSTSAGTVDHTTPSTAAGTTSEAGLASNNTRKESPTSSVPPPAPPTSVGQLPAGGRKFVCYEEE